MDEEMVRLMGSFSCLGSSPSRNSGGTHGGLRRLVKGSGVPLPTRGGGCAPSPEKIFSLEMVCFGAF